MRISEAKARCNGTPFRVVDNSGCNSYGYRFAIIRRDSPMQMTNTVADSDVVLESRERPDNSGQEFDAAALEGILC